MQLGGVQDFAAHGVDLTHHVRQPQSLEGVGVFEGGVLEPEHDAPEYE